MKSLVRNQRGFGHVGVLVLVAVVAVVGLVGYRVVKSADSLNGSDASFSASTTVPKSINSTADVKKASAALSNTPIDGTVNPNQLNNDLSSLL